MDTGSHREIPLVDQFHVANQHFWPILKQLVSSQRWTELASETEIGEHLCHHCLICGMWHSRFQELHGHYRLHHPDLIVGGVAKGAQISILASAGNPCALCSKSFQRVHSCTVALQLGVLFIQMFAEVVPPVAKRCEICTQDFDTMGALYRHLSAHHEQVINDWCPADALTLIRRLPLSRVPLQTSGVLRCFEAMCLNLG